MKIREVGEKNATGFMGIGKETRTQSAARTPFIEELKRVEEKQTNQELDDLLEYIDDKGKKLAERRLIEDLHDYKTKVKEFLATAIKKVYKLKEDMSFDRRGRHRIYSLVEKIDAELEELTKTFMDKQQDNLAIVAKVDEIRGMLLDIYM